MPQQLTPGTTSVDLSGAPGGDLSFDELFPPEGSSQQPPQAAGNGTEPSQTPQATTPAPPEFFLKAGDSVYKTAEDAVRGVEHKDSLITRYRDYLSGKGIDPDKLEPVQAAPQQQQSSFTYLNNGKKFYEDLSAAVSKGDANRYEEVIRTYNNEQLQASFAPIAPYIGEMARMKATREVSSEIPEFGNFLNSSDYQETLKSVPLLKQAIETAERDVNSASQLTDLYKIAYFTGQGRKPRTTPAVTPTQSTQPTRPTTAPSTMTPPPPAVSTRTNSETEIMRSSELRKQFVKDAEARGVLDIRF